MMHGAIQGHGGDRLFVTKIPQSVVREDVSAYFARFGTTTDVYLPTVPGSSGHKGIAFVSFQDPAALQLTMDHCPHVINGHEVVVDVAAPRGQGQPGSAPVHQAADQSVGMPGAYPPLPQVEESDRLFVTKVPPNLQKEHLRDYFCQFGELTDCYVPCVPGSPTHKGIAFVSFTDPAAVRAALQQGSHEILGHLVVVDVAAPRGTDKGGGRGDAGRPTAGQAFGYAPRGFSDSPPPTAQYAAAAHQQYQQYAPAQGHPYQAPPTSIPRGASAMVPAGVQGPAGSTTPGTAVPGRLFVTRVTPDMSRLDLQLYFQQFGELNDVFVPSGGKGIAFVSYRDPVVSQRVLEVHTHYVKPGQAVLVDQAIDRSPLGAAAPSVGKGGGFPRPRPY